MKEEDKGGRQERTRGMKEEVENRFRGKEVGKERWIRWRVMDREGEGGGGGEKLIRMDREREMEKKKQKEG